MRVATQKATDTGPCVHSKEHSHLKVFEITRVNPVNTHWLLFIIGVWKSQGRVRHCVRQRGNEQSETVNHRQGALLLCKAAATWLWSGSLPWHVGTALLALFHTVVLKSSLAETPHKHLH